MELNTKKIFIILGIIALTTQIIIGIITSTIYYINTKDQKPLIQSTIGLFFASDYNIYTSTKQLQTTNINKDYADYLKQKILLNIEIMLILIFITYILIQKIMNSSNIMEWGWLQKILIILIIILIFGAIEVLYVQLMYGQFTYPYKGIYNIFVPPENFYNLIQNIGIIENPIKKPDTIINNITEYIN